MLLLKFNNCKIDFLVTNPILQLWQNPILLVKCTIKALALCSLQNGLNNMNLHKLWFGQKYILEFCIKDCYEPVSIQYKNLSTRDSF